MVILSVGSEQEARTIFPDDPWAQYDISLADEVREWAIFLDARDKGWKIHC
jgi:hypothetical protein